MQTRKGVSGLPPLISIIVPVFNVEKYLPECLDSILNQTYSHLEIILIDDGSTDTSGQICDEYAAKDERVRVLHKSNEGLSAARNSGLDIAVGEYFCFVDSDDYVSRELCDRVMKAFTDNDAQIISFGCKLVDDGGKIIGSTESIHNTVLNREDALRELVTGNINNYYWNKVYKRHIFDDIRCPAGRAWEDLATMYKLFLKADSIYTLSEELYFYRQREGSISSVITESALVDIFSAKLNRYEHLKCIYPDIAQLCFMDLAKEALKLYDRSLWKEIDRDWITRATGFLTNNKEKILSQNPQNVFIIYFYYPRLYKWIRIFKHNAGNVLKYLYKILHK